MSDTETKKGLIEVIEDLMEKNLQEKAAKAAEADMTKKDEIDNPQDDLAKEEVKEEGQDTSIEKNVNDKELPDAEKETIANKQAAAPTAEPDKNETGAEPMKDVGGDKENNASAASAEVEADKPAHDQESDPITTPMKDESDPKKKVSEMKKDDMEEEEDEPKEMKKDMDEMASKEKEEELKGDQKKLDKDGDGDIDASDLAKVRKDGAKEEVKEMSHADDEKKEEEEEVSEMKKDMEELTDKQKKLFGDLLNDMKKGGGKMSKTAALQFEQMGLDYEIMTNKMSSGFSSFTHSVEKGLRTVMTVFSRIMLAVSVLSIAFIAIKSVMNFFSKDELARQKAYTEEVDKQVNSLKMFNEELDRMVEVRN